MHRLALIVALLAPFTLHAADHAVLGSKFSVKDPSTPDKRKVTISAKEIMTDDSLVGDPLTNGAVLSIRIAASAPDSQTYNLPAGVSPSTGKAYWSGSLEKGFKYKDANGENGPVSSVQIAHKNGSFKIKAKISGKLGTVSVFPPNPGFDACVVLKLTGGDTYSINYASATATNKTPKAFLLTEPTEASTCVPTNPGNLPIDHIVVLMQENRSADSYFSQLATQGQPGYETQPSTGNPDPTNPSGPPIVPFHKTTYCEVADLNHSWNGTHAEINNGAMDGFTAANVHSLDPTGSRAMGYYDQTDLPFYYGLYSTFATGDRYFSSVLSQTFPNRLFLLAGSSFGRIRNDFVFLPNPSIFNLLDRNGISWRVYASQYPLGYAAFLLKYVYDRGYSHVFPLSQYYADLAAGTLPQVAFVDPDQSESPQSENDEHPISNVQVGQKFVADVITGLMNSSAWTSSALFLTYDEHGGFYDHVVPPAAPIPDSIPPMLRPGDAPGAFDQYGIRVPVVAVSPYAKANFVSHVVHDHTSILRFIEYRFGLPALTNRDAAADPMLEFFDFSNPPFMTPPSLPEATIDQAQLDACPM